MTTQTIDPTTRRVPPLGGFNLTVLGIELRRMLRNRRTIIFTLVLPGRAAAQLRRPEGLGRQVRLRQRRGVHPDLDGPVRRGPHRRRRRLDGRPRAVARAGRASCG